MKKRFGIITTILTLILFGTILTGCGPEYGSLLLSLNVEQIEMSITDEKADYFITIENYFDFNAEFDFSFAKAVAKIDQDSVEHKGQGVYKFSIQPLIAESTTLTITLKGLDKPLTVPIIITREVTGISAHAGLFVVRGSNVKLNNSMFDFMPGDTNLKGLKFEFPAEYIEIYQTNGITLTEDFVLSAPEDCPFDSIWVTAISTYDANVTTTFEVLAINNINTTNFNLKIASQNALDPNTFDDYQETLQTIQVGEELVLSKDGTTPYVLDLVISDNAGFQKKLAVDYDLWIKGYETTVTAGQNILMGGNSGDIVAKSDNFDFVISATDVCESKITFKVYQANLTRNHVFVNLYIKATSKPKQIAINGQVNPGLVELYTHSTEVKEFNFSVVPIKADKNKFNYVMSFYKVKDIENGFIDEADRLSSTPTDYITVYYGRTEVVLDSATKQAELDAGNVEKLSYLLKLQAQESTQDEYIAIKLDCLEGSQVIASAVMYIKVYVGTTKFEIDESYADGTIYLTLDGGVQTFTGLKVDTGATAGKLTISSVNFGEAICDIEQVSTANCDLKITPKHVGEQEFVITTANNRSAVLKVIVFKQVSLDDFSLSLKESESGAVAYHTINNVTNSLSEVIVKGKESTITIQGNIANSEYVNSNSYSYELSFSKEETWLDDTYFNIKDNSIITSLQFTKIKENNTFIEYPSTLYVRINMYTVKDFRHEPQIIPAEELRLYEVKLSCVNYIKELSLYASEDANGKTKEKSVSIYNKGDLSYVNQDLATVYLYMDLKQSSEEEFTEFDYSNFVFSSNSLFNIDPITGEVKRGSSEVIGRLTLANKNKENPDATFDGYLGSFTYNYSGTVSISNIRIVFTVLDIYTSTSFSSAINITVEKYIDVDSLWLSTPMSVIYLDDTATYNSTSISVQVLPSNAMCKELDVLVETNYAGCIRVDNNPDTNILTFTYQSAGKGTIYIFPKSKMKTQSYYDEFGNMYYHLALEFVCANGETEQTALKISNYEDLKKISPNKHYYVDSNIDCKGNILDISVFNATLRGTFEPEFIDKDVENDKFETSEQIGSINNFKVSTNGTANIGLFRVLSEKARIYNLSFNGVFDNVQVYDEAIKAYKTVGYRLSDTTNIGLLCGTNFGTIKNVTVNLTNISQELQISNIATNDISVYMGLLAGRNDGGIYVTTYCKDYTLLVNTNSSKENIFKVNFTTEAGKLDSYFGGIVGNNTGIIQQSLDDNNDFVTIGLYGISSNVYASTNANFMAGVAGVNSGKIDGLKATGFIGGKAGYVSGFVGEILGGTITNNISRVFVSGTEYISGFVGKIAGTFNEDDIKNNIVQATDDGTKIGADASLIVGIGENSKLSSLYSYIDPTLNITINDANIFAETYFERNYPIEISSKYTGIDIEIPNTDRIALDKLLSKDYYYGDMLTLGGDADESIIKLNKFSQAQTLSFNTNYIKSFILPAFKKALLNEQQSYINNNIDTKSLLKFARIGIDDNGNFILKDISIEILNLDIANVVAHGKQIELNNIGSLDIKVISLLNYKKSAQFNVNITNYYESVKIFDSKDKNQELSNIQLLNSQTTNIYFDCYSNSYNYLNTPIDLVSNTEITFEYNYPDDTTNDFVITEIHGQTGYLKTTGGATTFEEKYINFVSKFIYGTTQYYRLVKETEDQDNNVIFYSDGQKIFAFVSQDDLSIFADEKLEVITKRIDAKKGVDSIKLNKSVIQAEPTDTIEIVATYVSYDNTQLGEVYTNNDTITPTLKVYTNYIANEYLSFALTEEDGTFKGISGAILNKTLFTLQINEPVVKELIYATGSSTEVVAVKYMQTYVLKMPVDTDFDIDVYNFLKDKLIELELAPIAPNNNIAKVLVQYTPESITSVLVNNYNKNNNKDMVITEDGITTVYADNIIYSGTQTSINEINVLNAYVYTSLSEFDYVDISMDIGVEGGFLAFIDYEYNDNVKVGHVSTNSVYTSISNGASLRIYKDYIKADNFSNTLPISLIYKIPRTVADSTYVPFEFKFYEAGAIIYSTQINLLAKIENQVSFEIFDKDPLNNNDDVLTYQVARGMRYLLDTTIVGYTDDQAVFESSSPNVAYVTKEGNDYYLNITQNAINYDGNPCYVVTINSYGQKVEYNKLQTSMIKSTELWIYDYLVNSKDLFDNAQIGVRMKSTVDIRDIIADKISFEYSKFMGNILNDFKQTYKDNATFIFVDEKGIEYDLSYNEEKANANKGVWFSKEVTNLYTIKCFKDSLGLHYNFTPLTIGEPCDYSFRVHHKIDYQNGVPVVLGINWEEDLSQVYTQDFTINTYVASSENNATPVYTYNDMLEMNNGEYYRQVADITIKATEFQMITAQPAMFDGNGYKIKITSGAIAVNIDNSSSFALFKSIPEKSVFKNISVVVEGNLTMTLNNALNINGANIAILVSENNGILTNCSVKSDSVVMADIISTVSVMEKSYFAGLCAINNGYITHCQVECNLTANGASLGGVVAENSGDIASTYIKNSRLYNTSSTTNENIVSGGFVCKNTGTINMCYIEGSLSSSRIYCDHPLNDYTLNSKIIYTSTKVAGFVYENSGSIFDSYSNIPIVSTNMCSGFVGVENGGQIVRTYSLCKLKSNDTLNYAYVISYNKDKSVFEDCFFVIEHNLINYNTSETNYKETVIANSRIYSKAIEGITPLSIEDFNVVDKDGQLKTNTPFANFIVDNVKENGIWFFAFDSKKENSPALSLALKNTYNCEVADITDAKGKAQVFTARRLQLVSPNLLAYSKYELELVSDDEFAEHTYVLSSDANALGSKTNPYIITSATEFENYCNQIDENRYEYFRLIRDINFANEEIYTTDLFDAYLVGHFEGNGFEVSSYAVNSITSNLSAGFFAQIGKQNTQISCIKNLNLNPTYINLPNSVFVGGLAGSLVNASAYNINMQGNDVVIVGRNIVGGIFGRTYGETSINKIFANITAKASKYDAFAIKNREDVDYIIKNICYTENGTNKTDVSYAGSIIGYVGGVSEINNVNIGEYARSQAMIAGLMFGGVGSLSTISNLDIELNSHINQVVAYAFAGLLTGENRGKFTNIKLNSNILGVDTFVCEPIKPIAVGGIAGITVKGSVDNLTSVNGYSVIGAEIINTNNNTLNPYNQYMVEYVGGIYGYAQGANINNVIIGDFKADGTLNTKDTGLVVMGGNYVGSMIGYIDDILVNELGVDQPPDPYAANPIDNNKYLKSTNIKNNKVNLISTKTYIDKDENEVTHKAYFSYVNMAVGDSYLNHTDIQKVGLVYGYATTNQNGTLGKLSAQPLDQVVPTATSDETTNIIIRSQEIDIYFGAYDKWNITTDKIGMATIGSIPAEDEKVRDRFLGKEETSYIQAFYNHYGTTESTHENIYIKVVDLKTGHFVYDLWFDWYKKFFAV